MSTKFLSDLWLQDVVDSYEAVYGYMYSYASTYGAITLQLRINKVLESEHKLTTHVATYVEIHVGSTMERSLKWMEARGNVSGRLPFVYSCKSRIEYQARTGVGGGGGILLCYLPSEKLG